MIRSLGRLSAVTILICSLAACSRGERLLCDDTGRYSTADSIPPVRIPDGLSPPDESESLRLPPPADGAASRRASGECLETPPPFFEDRVPS